MATTPQSAPMAAPGAAAPDSGAPAGDGATGGYIIEIKVAGDGSLTVCTETAAQESAEGGKGAGDYDANERPCKNIKEALTVALEVYKNNGEMQPAGAADADFQAGFSGKPAAAPAQGAM